MRKGLIVLVSAALTAGLGLQAFNAYADEVGLVEDPGLKIETIGADAGIANEKVSIDLPDLALGLEIDFQRLTQDLGIDPSLLANNVDEASADKALGDAVAFVAQNTGYQADDPGEVQKMTNELNAVQRAIDGYLASSPANVNPTAPIMKDLLDTTLPLFNAAADCRGRCLNDGAIRVIAITSILEAIKFAVNASNVNDQTKFGTEAAMIALQALIPTALIIRNRWKALPPETRQRFQATGLLTALNNMISLLTQSAAVAVNAIGGQRALVTATTAVAQAVVDNNAAGTPPGGTVQIDIIDDEL